MRSVRSGSRSHTELRRAGKPLQLRGRIDLPIPRFYIPSEKFFSGTTGYNDIEIVTTRGTFKLHIDRVPGSPQWPMTQSDRAEKFLDCAGRVLGSVDAKKLFDTAERCGQLAKIAELVRATVPTESRQAVQHAAV